MNVTIVTPSVHRRSGTEKCMSWLIEDLAHAANTLHVVTSSISDTDTVGVTTATVPVIRRPRLLYYLSFLYLSTARLLMRRRRGTVLATSGDCWSPSVIYAHFCCAAWLEQIEAGKVILPAGTPRQRLKNWQYKLFLRVAAFHEQRMYRRRSVRAIAAVSSSVAQEISRYYDVQLSRITVVPNAADDRVKLSEAGSQALRGEARAQWQLPSDACTYLFIGAGDWKRKGLGETLMAFAQLEDDSRLLVVGDEDIAHYRDLARAHNVAHRVMFTGRLSAIERAYAAADVFVYPSAYEAFPLVLLEAAAAGLPLVVAEMGGVAEIVRDGENGFIVARDPQSIAHALQQLGDPALRGRMSKAAREAAAPFTRAAVAASMQRILEAAR